MTVKDLTRGADPLTRFHVLLRQGDDIEEYDEGTKDELDAYTLASPVLYYRAVGVNAVRVTIW